MAPVLELSDKPLGELVNVPPVVPVIVQGTDVVVLLQKLEEL
jgi:hypothetical protein